MWVDALRVCREYLPAKLASLQAEYEREVGSRGARDVTSILSQVPNAFVLEGTLSQMVYGVNHVVIVRLLPDIFPH